MKRCFPVLFFCVLAACAAGESLVFDLPDDVTLEMTAVGGTSRLPVKYVYADGSENELEPFTPGCYYASRRLVDQEQYGAVTGMFPSERSGGKLPVTNVTMGEAVDFCARLNERCRDRLPAGYRFDVPTAVEWLHARRVDGTDVQTGVLEWLFTGSGHGGYVCAGGIPPGTNVLEDVRTIACFGRHRRTAEIGFRVVLVRIDAVQLGVDETLTKGFVLEDAGDLERAARYYRMVAETPGDRGRSDRARRALDAVREERSTVGEDWEGMMLALGLEAEKRGYCVKGLLDVWNADGASPAGLRAAAGIYRTNRVFGVTWKTDDLPAQVRDRMFAFADPDFAPGCEVRVAFCDFTGDGRPDLVTEWPGRDSFGFRYVFARRLAEGGYEILDKPIRCAGLCILPAPPSGKAAFAAVFKHANPELVPDLLVYENGEMTRRYLFTKPFRMLDASDAEVYFRAPFIGAGYGFAWKYLRKSGQAFHPLFWPW